MEAIEPKNALEKRLAKKEKWEIATSVNCYWFEDDCICNLCDCKIIGRHMIDGILSNSYEFALMCPDCHRRKGNGFGVGKGQLYTKLKNGKWLQTLGFLDEQIKEVEDNFD